MPIPSFNILHWREMHCLTTCIQYKRIAFWIILKISLSNLVCYSVWRISLCVLPQMLALIIILDIKEKLTLCQFLHEILLLQDVLFMSNIIPPGLLWWCRCTKKILCWWNPISFKETLYHVYPIVAWLDLSMEKYLDHVKDCWLLLWPEVPE